MGKGFDMLFTITPKTPKKEAKPLAKTRTEAYMWSDPSNIPFIPTNSYISVESWIVNFHQKMPFCLLYGPTSSGKSRIVHTISVRYCLHLIEIDCASAKDIKSCIDTANEATQSRSVGSFLETENENQSSIKPTSMVVFEHIDALFTAGTKVSQALLNLLSSSRVPIIATCNKNFFKPAEWMLVVYVPKIIDAFSVLKESTWFKQSKNQLQTEMNVRKLLYMTNYDIRQTSLQMMFNDSSEKFLPRDEQIYHSLLNENSDTSTIDLNLYPDYLDLLTSIDSEDLFWNSKIDPNVMSRPLSDTDKFTKEVYDYIGTKFQASRTSYMPITETIEFAAVAAQNCQMKTRTLRVLPLSKIVPITEDDTALFIKAGQYP